MALGSDRNEEDSTVEVEQQSLPNETASMLMAHFDMQRSYYQVDPVPEYRQRKEDLINLKRMINENREELIAAMNADYGNRSRHEIRLTEIISVTDGINDVIKRLKKWMRVQKRHVDMSIYAGGKNRVIQATRLRCASMTSQGACKVPSSVLSNRPAVSSSRTSACTFL